MTRLLRLLLAWLCLVSPWLAVVSAEVLLVERNVPTEERDPSGEELDEAALSGARRAPNRRHAPRLSAGRDNEWPRNGSLARKVARPPLTTNSYRPPTKVLLRRVPLQSEDPFSISA